MLNWLDILNEQATWTCLDDAALFLEKNLRLPAGPTESQVESFHRLLNFIRDQVFTMHFEAKVDIEAVNERLSRIKVELRSQKSGSEFHSASPSFLAYNPEYRTEPVETLSSTVLFQFAHFAGQWLENPSEIGVCRCEGLYRDESRSSISPVANVPAEIELAWRREIDALNESGLLESSELLRCADLFSGRKGRFCSDECRFRTFSITRRLKQPDYLAEKQRRYRQRKKD